MLINLYMSLNLLSRSISSSGNGVELSGLCKLIEELREILGWHTGETLFWLRHTANCVIG